MGLYKFTVPVTNRYRVDGSCLRKGLYTQHFKKALAVLFRACKRLRLTDTFAAVGIANHRALHDGSLNLSAV